MDWSILIVLLTPLVTAGAAIGGIKVGLNGSRERIRKIETNVDEHKILTEARHLETVQRLTRIETKLDTL